MSVTMNKLFSGNSKGLSHLLFNKRYLLGISLILFICFLLFHINNYSYDGSSSLTSTSSSPNEKTNKKYLIVIETEAKYYSRRKLIRSVYFDIQDNLVPTTLDDIRYTFLVYGGPPESDTVERREYESEKMEYNDLSQLPTNTVYNQQTVLEWVSSNYLKRKEQDWMFDYLIVQDIHSFIPINRLIDDLNNGRHSITENTSQEKKNFVLDRPQYLQAITSKNNQNELMFTSQIWENNVESIVEKQQDLPLIVTHVYQDEDFMELARTYKSQPVLTIDSHDKKNPSIAVVTSSYIYNKCMEPSGTKASLNKRDYADKHGYAFVARSKEFAQQAIRPDQRRTVWGKIDAIQKVLPKYEWVFWLDMDAVILNSDQSIEVLFDRLGVKENDIDFIIVRPGTDKMINAGVFLIKNTNWSFEFLKEVQSRTEWYQQGPSYEQGAMWDVMRQPEYMNRTLFLDRENHVFNTFPQFYEDDDFIVHFAPDKCPNSATLKGLAAADKIKKGGKITTLDLL
ncbi:MAG: hypothetical protein EXX96DRAFT_499878 [Benjaminiella poitrasii]|nr:MAG: hypothetical protein EXX96DRAFT_499878 [Benjaminiella poitrasii]